MRTAAWITALTLGALGASTLGAEELPDTAKRAAELSTEALVDASSAAERAGALYPYPSSDTNARDLIRWHGDLAAAQQAAQVTGRPVLLFQLLGALDQEHC